MVFDEDMIDNSNTALETLVSNSKTRKHAAHELTREHQIRVGMSIGHSPDHAPHTPDMRKENPSMAEKQEAKRRIEGSFAPSTRAMPTAANMQ